MHPARPLRTRPFSLVGAAILLFVGACSFCSGQGSGETSPEAPAARDKGAGPAVDGERALDHIRKIIAFGPRHAGTEGAEKTRKYILQTLRGYGLEPRRHDFKAYTPHPDLREVMMANLSVDIPGPGDRVVLVGGHFDGKIIEGVTFEGANDGGSSTALLLELARVLSASPPPCPVKLVFFDGEEALLSWTDSDSRYGSKNMAGELKASGELDRLAAVVVVDMIGDARLKLLRDTNSTRWVSAALERNARRLGHGEIFEGRRAYIDDDHTPFLQLGVPAAVMIDLDYGPGWQSNAYWHTEKDSIDKLSPLSIEIVGRVVLTSLGELARGAAGAGKERSR